MDDRYQSRNVHEKDFIMDFSGKKSQQGNSQSDSSDSGRFTEEYGSNPNKKKYKKRKQFNISEPITSYGLILYSLSPQNISSTKVEDNIFQQINNETQEPSFLIYQRRDNFEYMDFLRGVWSSEGQLPALFSLMSKEERERIRNYTFQELWDDLWVVQDCRLYRDGFAKAKKKYDSIKTQIPNLLDVTTSCIKYPPWGFPKGKKNGYYEDPLKCAIREFEEETKLSISSDIKIIPDVSFIENFKGSNGKAYATHYYLGEISNTRYPNPISTPQCIRKTTISEEATAIGWFTMEETKKYLNPRRQTILRGAFEKIEEEQRNNSLTSQEMDKLE